MNSNLTAGDGLYPVTADGDGVLRMPSRPARLSHPARSSHPTALLPRAFVGVAALPLLLGATGCALRADHPAVQRNPTSPSDTRRDAAATAPATAFVDVAVIPMDRERVLAHQTVVVQEGRITALGPVRDVHVPAGATRVDGRGKFLLPGLGDMHTHIAYGGTRHTERHLLLVLAAGVTTVRNMDYLSKDKSTSRYEPYKGSSRWDGPGLLRLKARVAGGELLGPRIYTSAAWRADSTKSVDDNVAAYKAAGYDHIKWYGEDSMMTDSLAAAAHRLGVPLVGHGMEPSAGGLRRTLALGFKSIEHMVPYTNDSTLPVQVAATVRAGVWNCLCPLLYFGTADPSPLERRYGVAQFRALTGTELDTTDASLYSKRQAVPALPVDSLGDFGHIARALRASGAKLLLGSDMLAMSIPPTTLHHSIQNAVRVGFTPYEALALVTRNVAEYFGTLDSTGTIAVGKRADLVLLAGSPLEDIRHVHDVAGVVAGGRWLPEAELWRRLDALFEDVSRAGP